MSFVIRRPSPKAYKYEFLCWNEDGIPSWENCLLEAARFSGIDEIDDIGINLKLWCAHAIDAGMNGHVEEYDGYEIQIYMDGNDDLSWRTRIYRADDGTHRVCDVISSTPEEAIEIGIRAIDES